MTTDTTSTRSAATNDRTRVAAADVQTSALTVRAPRFDLPDDLADTFDGDLSDACSRVAFSLILPHLEPYLIRVYRALAPHVSDRRVAADIEAFCGQEAQHHRGHAAANRKIRAFLGPDTSARLLAVERRLAADYRRFETQRSLRFQAAFIEGFEAMTCAMGMTGLETGRRPAGDGPWAKLWRWHLFEELEHRTVAFDVYEHIGGGWAFRAAVSAYAQRHFLRALDELHGILMEHHGAPRRRRHLPPLLRQGWRRWLLTYSPRYDPHDIELPDTIGRYLATLPAARGA
jgi:uncharacterized protein